ncbi:MAG: retropepsin-like aspartic protease, partial [Acidobacteriota bacterium]
MTSIDRIVRKKFRAFFQGVLVLSLAALLQARAHIQEITVHYQQSRKFNAMLVIAQVNGKAAVLIVDTGSSRTMISPELVANRNMSAKFPVSFPFAGRSEVSSWGEASLQVGWKRWKQHLVVVQDQAELRRIFGQQIDGILGQDILGEFRRVIIDSEHHTLTL